MKRKQTFKEFCKEHKVEIIVGGIAIVGAIVGFKMWSKKLDIKGKKIADALKEAATNFPHETHRFVDEDIFTDLAPAIEEAVLEEGLDEDFFEKFYKVSYPLGGDPKNGFYDVKKYVKKYVKVLVQDAGDWEE